MVAITELLFGSILFAVCAWSGYRSVTAGRLYRSLSGIDTYSSGVVDGETAAIEGEVVVEEPAEAAGQVVEATDAPVGAYVWHGWYPDAGNDYTLDGDGLNRKQNTFASGIEWGTFAVVDGGREIRVDPSWLAATHDSTELSTFSLDGVQTSTPLSGRTWKSPYVHLADYRSEVTFEAVADVITTDENDADPAEHYLESKAIPEGERLCVRGEVRVEQGEPVIRGSEGTPLVLSDQGFDGLGSDLRTRVAKYGLISLGTLATAAVLVTRAFGVSPL